MAPRIRDTIRFRLSVYIFLTMLMVGTLVACFTLFFEWKDRKKEFERHGQGVAEQVAVPFIDDLLREDGYALYKSVETVKNFEAGSTFGPVEYIEVLGRDGGTLVTVQDSADENTRSYMAANKKAAAATNSPSSWTNRLPDGTELVDSAYPVFFDGARIGTVRVGLTDKRIRESMRKTLWQALSIVLAACLLGVVFGGRIAQWVSRPVGALVRGAEEFSSGNMEYHVDVQAPREMKVLADSFNEMAGSLKEKMESLDKSRDEAEQLSEKLAEAYNESRLSAERLQQTNEWVTDLAFRLEEANQSLKTEKVQTDTIVHSIREGLVALDAQERIILVNPEAEDIFGIKEDEAKGEPVQMLVEKLAEKVEDPEEFLKKFMAAVSTPDTESVFTVTIVKPFKRVLRRHSSAIRDESGHVIGRVVTFRDITREREVDDMKTNFVSTVSHELRTPLTSIKGAVNLLLDGQIDDPETRREFLRIAEQNTDRLINLITTLLDLSRMEEGRVRMKFGRLDLNALSRSVIKSTSVLAKQNGVQLDASYVKGPLHVLGDKDKLEQVVTNLIGNAIKFSNPGGAVRVITSVRDEDIHLAVEDEGVGIPRDKLEKIFDRFYQVDMSATRRKGGTGLGLAISKAIIKEHGGHAWAESPITPDGKGARFVVSLPRNVVAAQTVSVPSRPAVLPASMHTAMKNERTVLLVDSDPDALKVHKKSFEREGFKALTAATGSYGLRLAREHIPGFILLDAFLPDLDGFDFVGILKNDDKTRDIHIILTSFLDDAGMRRCVELGCGYLDESSDEGELISAVKKILR